MRNLPNKVCNTTSTNEQEYRNSENKLRQHIESYDELTAYADS